MAEIRLRQVCKTFDRTVHAVRDFTMDIADREFVVLVGPSGCGKSTMLRMIAGLEQATSGEIYIGGRLVNDVPPKDRDVAMVFQNYALFPYLTVFDNIAFGLSLRHEPKAEIKRKVQEAARILDITELLDRKPRALSGGQRQRVAIGRAIVHQPQIFLMDEPLSNLDAKLRNQMRAELIRLRQHVNTTFVYVTHDQTEAMTLGDRIVVMKDGWVQQIGTPREIFDHPANLFVAGFIGTPQMNLLPGQLLRSGEGYGLALNDQVAVLPKEIWPQLSEMGLDSREVILGVRPDYLEIGDGPFLAKVEVCELLGSQVQVHMLLGDQRVVALVPEDEWVRAAGDNRQVRFALPHHAIQLFDPTSGENLLV